MIKVEKSEDIKLGLHPIRCQSCHINPAMFKFSYGHDNMFTVAGFCEKCLNESKEQIIEIVNDKNQPSSKFKSGENNNNSEAIVIKNKPIEC